MAPAWLDAIFKLTANKAAIKTEITAGATTFLTMAYIIFVNPAILQAAGIDQGAAFTATCLASALGSLLMGVYANYPVALAPGMGINAYFAYSVVQGMGHPWQTALGAVFVASIIFMILSVLPVRQWIINAIPMSQKMAIAAGIGLLLSVIALKNGGVIESHPATLVSLGQLTKPETMLACFGFVAMAGLSARKVPGALLIVMLAVTVAGIALGINKGQGIISPPPSLAPTFLQMDIWGALQPALIPVVVTFLIVAIFDATGTLVGVAYRARMLDENGDLPRLRQALLADSAASVAGAAMGTSTTTCYIESAAGVDAGGRTGLTAAATAALFLLCLFFSPLAASVPQFATAPALLFVACMMIEGLAKIDWRDITEAAPAVVTTIAVPLTFSISSGIGLGFITYVAVKIVSGRWRAVNPAILVIAMAFVYKFAML